MGLGAVGAVGLAHARLKAADARKLLDGGRGPIEARKIATNENAAVPTFGAYAEALHANIESGFRNETHRDQWLRSLKTHAVELLPLPVDQIETEYVLKDLLPIWTKKIPDREPRARADRACP